MHSFPDVHGVRGKPLHTLTRTLLISIASLAILAAGAGGTIAAGGNGTGGVGGADANTGAGGTGGSGTGSTGGGGGGAGQTGGAGGFTLDQGNPLTNGGAGGLAPAAGTFVGGNGGDGTAGTLSGGGGGGGAHGFVGTNFTTLTGAAQGGDGGNGVFGGGGGAGGYGVVITGTGNIGNSGQTATGGDGGHASGVLGSASGGGSGGAGLVFGSAGVTANINAMVSGGNGGNGGETLFGLGPGGTGGAGVVSLNGGNITTSAAVRGGNGGENGNGGAGIVFGGSGTLTTGATTTGGNGVTGGAGIVVTGAANLIAGGTVTGGNGAAGVSFGSTGTFTIIGAVQGGGGGVGANVTTSTTTTINGTLTGGAGSEGASEFGLGSDGSAGASGLVLAAGGTVNVNAATSGGVGGAGGYGGIAGNGGVGGAAIVLSNGGIVNVDAAVTGGAGGAGGDGQFGGSGRAGGTAIVVTTGGTINVNAAIKGGAGGLGGGSGEFAGNAGGGGAGMSGAGIAIALTTPGSVAGSGGADAITFTGGSNSITGTGGVITGVVRVGTGASLAIDGSTLGLTSAISDIQLGGTLNLSGNVTTGDIAQITTTGSEIHYANGAVVASAILLNSNDTTLDVDTGDAAEQSGNITETGGIRPIEKTGGGTLVLSGTNTHTGATTISGGTLELKNGAAISNSGAVVLDNTAGVNLVVTDSETIGSLAGGGTTGGNVQIAVGQTLSTGGANSSTSFTGAISGSGGLTKQGTGTFTLAGTNSYGGTTTISGGTLEVQGGAAISDSGVVVLDNTAGANLRVTSSETIGSLAGGGATGGNVEITLGQVLTTGGANTSTSFAGAISGAGGLTKTGSGTFTLAGSNSHAGTTTISGGTLELRNGSAISNTGTVELENAAGVTLLVTNSETIGSLLGGGANGGNVLIAVGQTLTTGGSSSAFGGVISGSGGLTKQGPGTLTLSGTNTYGGITTVTSGTLNVTGSLTGTSQLDITGGGFMAYGNSLVDTASVNVSGFGIFSVSGSETIGALNNNGAVSLGGNNLTGDVLTTGALSGTGTVNLDINLQTGATDRLHVASVAAGASTTYAFDNLGGAWLIPDVLVVENEAATYDGAFSSTGLPTGLVSFSLIDNGGDLYVRAEAELGVLGGITDAVALTQSTIGAMLDHAPGRDGTVRIGNVPGSDCGVGAWQRGLGGSASGSAETLTDTGSSAGAASVDLSFGGGQFGLDIACADVGGSGVDVALGAFGGFAAGSTTQAIDGTLPSTTEASFRQGSGGVYASIAKDQFSAELQARYDATDFTFNNSNAAFGLVDAGLHTDRYTISGSASYALSLGEVDLTPRAGFSISETTASVLEFQNGETLAPDAALSLVGFVGGTLSKTFLLEDQLTAITPFVSGALYNDFADAPTSLFTDQVGNELNLVSENQGLVGEASLGIGLSRPFGDNAQFDASLTVNARFSDQLEGYGLAAKARLQF